MKAQAVVEMFQRYANGVESMSTLAAWLNGQGFCTKSKKPQVIMGEVVEGAAAVHQLQRPGHAEEPVLPG